MYYTKNAKNMGEDLICNILGCRVPISANVQREAFQSILQETVGANGELPIIQNIHDNLVGLIAEHKEDEAPLELNKKDIERLLENSGMEEKELRAFNKSFDELAGGNTSFLAANIIDAKVFEVRLPDVVIKVNPDRADLVETQTIDGKRCVVIQADQDIEVNGVRLAIK